MKGLIIKDCLVITRQLKLFLLIIPIMAIIGGTSTASIAILLGAVLPMTAIAYDEQSKWDELAVMMPYSKRSLVLSKYLLGYLCMAGSTVIYAITKLIFSTVWNGNAGENLFLIYYAILNGLFLIAINTPILFRFGTQKGRFVFIVFLGLVAASGTAIKEFQAEIPRNLIENLPVFLLVIAIIMNLVSVNISLRIKHK